MDNRNHELYHYGVKGMKWGVRRAEKYRAKARFVRESADEWDEIGTHQSAKLRAKGKNAKADKVAAKYASYAKQDRDYADKLEAKAVRKTKEADFQRKQAEVAESRSLGSKFCANVIAGPFANRTYNSVRASGGSQMEAAAVTFCAAWLGGPVGHIAVAHLYTKNAGKRG